MPHVLLYCKVIIFLSLALACFFMHHACGALAPFRDAGEFAVAAHYLTIAHPPGYPFYTMLSKLWITFIPFGNIAYRLNVLSALAAAGAFGLTAFWLRRSIGVSLLAALVLSALLFSTRVVLGLSFVSEMYTLGFLWFAFLLFLIHKSEEEPRALFLLAFAVPLALATRLDLAFGLVYALAYWPLWFSSGRRRIFWGSLIFFILGSSVFLYPLIRSQAGPLVNWGDPSTISKLWDTLMRKSHGGTLDLLSASYQKGELFWADFGHWARVVWETFGPLVVFLPMGLYALGSKPRVLAASLLAWFLSGPVFLYMANMPPNPHALKILEDHFVPSLFMAALWAAVGLDIVLKGFKNRLGGRCAAFAALAIFILFRVQSWSLRDNFYAYDYANNIFRSASSSAAVVLHEDVQLFSVWEGVLNRKRRPDLHIIGQGLSGAAWYQRSLAGPWGYKDLVLGPKLAAAGGWENLLRANSRMAHYAGYETEAASGRLRRIPQGLLTRLCLRGDPACDTLGNRKIWPLIVLRRSSGFDFTEEPFFFNRDLLEDYSRAALETGRELLAVSDKDQGARFLKTALVLNPSQAQASTLLAFHFFNQSNLEESLFWWQRSREKLLELLGKARSYRALPEAAASLRKDLAYVLTSMGVVLERQGASWPGLLRLHQEAVSQDAASVIAHYNLASVYWRMKDVRGARKEFQEVLRLDPGNAEAQKFLRMLP